LGYIGCRVCAVFLSDFALRGDGYLEATGPESRLLAKCFLFIDMKKSQFLSVERKNL
jgi:hypothetical protein